MKQFSIIVALDDKNGIGKQGDLAWRLSGDLKHFKEITTSITDPNKKNAVIMGRKTWDSLPFKFKPLPDRWNVVLSRNTPQKYSSDVLFFTFLDEALEYLSVKSDVDKIFVIGGAQIYSHALEHPNCQSLHITHLKGDFQCDAFFPPIPDSFKKYEQSPKMTENNIQFYFSSYQRHLS